MLRFLRVRNFALIDTLELTFETGFNLLSGETGAGKSILVDALGLLTGSKASTDMIRTGEARAIIEAAFECNLADQLLQFGLDPEESEIIVRREISTDGRNRVYINNQPTTLSALRDLSPALLDIHGQHDQQFLLQPARQLAMVDAFADAVDAAGRVRQLSARLQQVHAELQALQAEDAKKSERLDLLAFQDEEIRKADPKPNEAETARAQLDVLAHAGKLLDVTTRAFEALYESEGSVIAQLSQNQRTIRDASQHDSRLTPFVEQLDSVRILVQDVAYSLRHYAGSIEADPKELERLQSRLSELERLQRKYGPDLLQHLHTVRREMDSIGLAESRKRELIDLLEQLRREYTAAAAALSKQRRAASKKLESLVIRELKSLAMPNARFQVLWSDADFGRPEGIDHAEFQISANPGEELRPIDKIASGGELSRIMLSLRTVLSGEREEKTLVFDEVDAGIGGKAAETVGQKLRHLSSRYQVLCVTHLAQVAAFAAHQYRIEKLVVDGRTVTRIEKLSGDARIEELARMMSGSRVTEAARQHVKELLAGH